jgi:hypothetical protein
MALVEVTTAQIQRCVCIMKLSAPLQMEGATERKKEQETLSQQLTFVQSLLQQLAAAAHDLCTCVQRAAHSKSRPK